MPLTKIQENGQSKLVGYTLYHCNLKEACMKTELSEFGNIYVNHKYNCCTESTVLNSCVENNSAESD